MSRFISPIPMNVDMVCPINWQHPLCRGIVGWWQAMPGTQGGSTLINLADVRAPGILASMDPVTDWIGSPCGPVLDFDGTNDRVVANDPLGGVSTNTVSFLSVLTHRSLSGYVGILGGANGAGLLMNGSPPHVYSFYWNGLPYEYDASSGLTVPIGSRHAAMVCFSGSRVVLWLGRSDGSVSSYAVNATQSAKSLGSIYIGQDRTNVGRNVNGTIESSVMFGRTVSDVEAPQILRQSLIGRSEMLNHLTRRMTSLPPADVATPMASYYYRNLLAGAA